MRRVAGFLFYQNDHFLNLKPAEKETCDHTDYRGQIHTQTGMHPATKGLGKDSDRCVLFSLYVRL